jgi:hypothetical protein
VSAAAVEVTKYIVGLYRRGRRPASRCWLTAFAWVMWRREFM